LVLSMKFMFEQYATKPGHFEFLAIKDANTAAPRIYENRTTLMICCACRLSVKWCYVHFAKYAVLSIHVLRNGRNSSTLTWGYVRGYAIL
jgi:hypothetical protein